MTTLYEKKYFRARPEEDAREVVAFVPYESQDDGSYAPQSTAVISGDVAISHLSEYKDGEVLEPNGASVTATIPAGTNSFWIDVEGGAIYYEINPAGDASASSPGYVEENGHMIEGPLSNLNSLKVFGEAGAIAHIRYYEE